MDQTKLSVIKTLQCLSNLRTETRSSWKSAWGNTLCTQLSCITIQQISSKNSKMTSFRLRYRNSVVHKYLEPAVGYSNYLFNVCTQFLTRISLKLKMKTQYLDFYSITRKFCCNSSQHCRKMKQLYRMQLVQLTFWANVSDLTTCRYTTCYQQYAKTRLYNWVKFLLTHSLRSISRD